MYFCRFNCMHPGEIYPVCVAPVGKILSQAAIFVKITQQVLLYTNEVSPGF